MVNSIAMVTIREAGWYTNYHQICLKLLNLFMAINVVTEKIIFLDLYTVWSSLF